jgi:hypothetical protein
MQQHFVRVESHFINPAQINHVLKDGHSLIVYFAGGEKLLLTFRNLESLNAALTCFGCDLD